MTRPVVHQTGLMPPSAGPVRTKCGRRVPIEQTYHVERRGRKKCKACQRVMDRKKRLGLWPWTKTQARISEGVRLAWKRRKDDQR